MARRARSRPDRRPVNVDQLAAQAAATAGTLAATEAARVAAVAALATVTAERDDLQIQVNSAGETISGLNNALSQAITDRNYFEDLYNQCSGGGGGG